MKFLPEYSNASDIKNKAESLVMKELMKSKKFSDAIVLHSLMIPRHISKMESEVDFVLLGKFGLICLEVKGGNITRHNGVWRIGSKNYGYNSNEGPFKQASSGIQSLVNDIIQYSKRRNKEFFIPKGYGVLFPEVEFNIESEEWDNAIVYKASDRLNNIDKYLERLILHWQQKNNYKELATENISFIENYFKGNIRFTISLLPFVKNSREKIIELTEEQNSIFSGLYENPRLLVNGLAGTGKTICAQRFAIQKASEDKKVGFFCFNVLASLASKNVFSSSEYKNSITTSDIISFVYNYLDTHYPKTIKSIRSTNTAEGSNIRKLIFDEFCRYFPESEKFDALIIDEGQDIINEDYYDLLNCLVKGGIQKGQWAFFYDSEIQAGMYEQFDKDILSIIKDEANPILFNLKKNCRNTIDIIDTIEKVTNFKIIPLNKDLKGSKVEFIPFSDPSDQKQKIYNIINALKKDKIQLSEIDMVSFCGLKNSIFSKYETEFGKQNIVEFNQSNLVNREDKVCCTSIGKYKGLENDVILLTDFTFSDDIKSRTIMYTSMTRARSLLYIFLHKSEYDKIKRAYND